MKSIAGQGPDVDVDKSLRAFQFESSKHDHNCHTPPPIESLSIINYLGLSKARSEVGWQQDMEHQCTLQQQEDR